MTQKEVARKLVNLFKKQECLLRGRLNLRRDGVYFESDDYKGKWFDSWWSVPEFRKILRQAYENGISTIEIKLDYPKLLIEVDGQTFQFHWD